ncbi:MULTISPECIES: hypothetical protein [unclassified Breznakia]|uniref:hypothetical protein n=1 Tax=unclassified Breznakia TaxID=2623764 RepID=UPI0024763F58|nr:MULTISPECIES: hypothetical protein [unclassified Breznakia]MDH6367874.1 hypothetical protein [Breznakia sp. PH1-1]MDH6404962.1 hypothetical protein [Breznakia sp. PF1-11]MDH6412677.1 hypothetical protein [Breznakia sp. PFB1-11]MDH6415020.1 hypothetical protein [Breznakia sp. PFB1-14]MDH6417348.1 hypothetical protein [Breznakia sp. PFB1-4]
MASYNYTIAEEYKSKFVIPYIGLEFSGWTSLVTAILGILTIGLGLGFPLSLILGTNGFFISFGLAVTSSFIFVAYNNEMNNETGTTKVQEIFYLRIKQYRKVYDRNGIPRYLQKKKKGVLYSARR